MQDRAPPAPARWRAGLAALFALVVAVNLNTLPGAFLSWDDALYVSENRRVQISALADLARIWSPADALAGRFVEFFPLRDSLYALLYLGVGLTPWPYHLLQVGLHALVCVGVAQLLLRWIGPLGAAVGAVTFAVHPIHVESVAWIAALKDPLSTAFLVGALLCWGHHRDAGSRPAYAGAIACMIGAVLVKSFGILLPGMLVLVDWAFFRRPVDRRLFVDKLPFVAVAFLALALILRIGAANGVTDAPPPGGSGYTNFLTMTSVYAIYLGKLLVPVGLSSRYVVYPILHAVDPRFLGSVAVIVLVWGVSIALVPRTRVPLFTNAWILGCLTLVLRIIPLPIEMADRYLYLPSIGYAALVGTVAAALWERRPAWRTGLVVVGIAGAWALVAGSVARNLVWRDDEALWSDVVAKAPTFPIGWASLGSYYVREGRDPEAQAALRRALELDPDNVTALVTLAVLEKKRGQLDTALALFQRAATLDPGRAKAWSGVGAVYLDMKRPADARVALERALVVDPAYPTALRNLAMVCVAEGDPAGATEAFSRAVRAAPHDRGLLLDLLRWLAAVGDAETARTWSAHVDAWFAGDAEVHAALARAQAGT